MFNWSARWLCLTSKEDIPNVAKIGQTTQLFTLTVNDIDINGLNVLNAFEGKLEAVYPTEFEQSKVLEDVPALVSDTVI